MWKTAMLLALAALPALAASRAATEEWVRRYVATNTPSASARYSYEVTNGFVRIVGEDAGETITVTGEVPDRLALMATNCTGEAVARGVTDGMLFAWNGQGEFINAPAGKSIAATPTNFVFEGIASHVDGIDRFGTLFGVYGLRITPSVQAELLGQEAAR